MGVHPIFCEAVDVVVLERAGFRGRLRKLRNVSRAAHAASHARLPFVLGYCRLFGLFSVVVHAFVLFANVAAWLGSGRWRSYNPRTRGKITSRNEADDPRDDCRERYRRRGLPRFSQRGLHVRARVQVPQVRCLVAAVLPIPWRPSLHDRSRGWDAVVRILRGRLAPRSP